MRLVLVSPREHSSRSVEINYLATEYGVQSKSDYLPKLIRNPPRVNELTEHGIIPHNCRHGSLHARRSFIEFETGQGVDNLQSTEHREQVNSLFFGVLQKHLSSPCGLPTGTEHDWYEAFCTNPPGMTGWTSAIAINLI